MDSSEDLFVHCSKPNQPSAAGLDWLQGLYYVVLHERQGHSETSEGLTHS